MAEVNSTTITPEEQKQEFEWLGDLMRRAFWPLDALFKTLRDHEVFDDLMLAVFPLLDGARANLAILEEVLAQSFGGHIRVETTDFIELFGLFLPDYFGKAYVHSEKEEKPMVAAGGE